MDLNDEEHRRWSWTVWALISCAVLPQNDRACVPKRVAGTGVAETDGWGWPFAGVPKLANSSMRCTDYSIFVYLETAHN